MRISGIYKIASKFKKERIYIGSGVNIKRRWNEHKSDLSLNKHHSQKLQRHYNKYGLEDLIFIIIEPCFDEFLLIREQYYIDKLHPYFNCAPKAFSQLGIKRSEEAKQRMREAKQNISIETRKKMSESQKGKNVGENNNFYGKHHSEEQKKKWRIIRKQKRLLEYSNRTLDYVNSKLRNKGNHTRWHKGYSYEECPICKKLNQSKAS